MTRMRLSVTALAIVLLSGASPLMAKKYTVDTSPEKSGRIYVNNVYLGVAPQVVDLKLSKNTPVIVHAERAGAVSYWPTTVHKGHKGIIKVRLEPDQSYAETSDGSDIANKWRTIEARMTVDAEGKADESLIWQKIVSIVSDRFSDLEQVDRGSFYLRSSWRIREYPFTVLRHRIVVKRGVSTGMAVKVKLESEVFVRSSPQIAVDKDKFKEGNRIFSEDGETVQFLQDQL